MEAALDELIPKLPFAFLVFLRVSIVFASLPAPFGNGPPPTVRVATALMVSMALCSGRLDEAPIVSLSPLPLAAAALGEVFVGAVIGLTVRVTLAAAEVAGNMAGLSMGQGFAATLDPAFGEQMLPVGRLLAAVALLLFFTLGGHHVMLNALAWSLDHAPVDGAFSDRVHDGVVNLGAGLMSQGFRIASPILGAMFIVQMGMGLIARSAPRVQVFSLMFAVTSVVGGLTLFSAAPTVVGALGATINRLPDVLRASLIAS